MQMQMPQKIMNTVQSSQTKLNIQKTMSEHKTIKSQKSILATSKDKKQSKVNNKKSAQMNDIQKKNKKVTLEQSEWHNFNVYFRTMQNQKWKPEVRENSDFVVDQIRMKGYLIFGLGTELYNDVTELDLKNYKWTKLNQSGDQAKQGRCSHNSVYYNRNVYIFGGERLFNPIIKQRECLSDLRSLKIDVENQNEENRTNKWKLIRTSGEIIEGRRNHAGCQFSKYILISGGINSKNQYMNDYWIFDINSHIWMKLNISNPNSIGNMAFHQIQAIFHETRTKISPGKFLTPLDETVKNFIMQEGIYIFGGKSESGQLWSNLMVLKFDCYPMTIVQLQTEGVGPQARYGHRMKYIASYNILIIHGGINDQNGSSLSYLNDMFVLNLSNLVWINVQCFGQEVQQRAFFQMDFINNINKLIIFGGINPKGYQTNDVIEVEIDQLKVQVLSQDTLNSKTKKVEEKQPTQTQLPQQNDDFQQYLENLNYKNFVTYLPKPKNTTLKVFQKEVKRLSNMNSLFSKRISNNQQEKIQIQTQRYEGKPSNHTGTFSNLKKSISQAIYNIKREDSKEINTNIRITDQSQTPRQLKKLDFNKLGSSRSPNHRNRFGSMIYM